MGVGFLPEDLQEEWFRESMLKMAEGDCPPQTGVAENQYQSRHHSSFDLYMDFHDILKRLREGDAEGVRIRIIEGILDAHRLPEGMPRFAEPWVYWGFFMLVWHRVATIYPIALSITPAPEMGMRVKADLLNYLGENACKFESESNMQSLMSGLNKFIDRTNSRQHAAAELNHEITTQAWALIMKVVEVTATKADTNGFMIGVFE